MPIDPASARAFVMAEARLLDQVRLAAALGEPVDAEALRAALSAYAAPGGGYGAGLEPDLRAPEAQPAAAMHALEALADLGAPAPEAAALCDWLARTSLPDGGLPFARPVWDPAGCAPFWLAADPGRSSLQITAAVAAQAHRAARHDPAVAMHPWLMLATAYGLGAMEQIQGPVPVLSLMFSLRLLAEMEPRFPRAQVQLERLAGQLPRSGRLPVEGGADDEFMRPLDFSPTPDDPVRPFIAPERIEEDLDRLEAGQDSDGGWRAEWLSYSDEARREWRGYLTVRALALLHANGRL
ncbi:MAG: hypothetical protein RIB67_01145 [Miltoncostaeaceae bacterium]